MKGQGLRRGAGGEEVRREEAWTWEGTPGGRSGGRGALTLGEGGGGQGAGDYDSWGEVRGQGTMTPGGRSGDRGL